MERRNFLKGLGRYAIFSILAGVTAVTIKKAGHPEEGGCRRHDLCPECGMLAGCNLPGAVRERQNNQTQNS